jgi:hypothetical protein
VIEPAEVHLVEAAHDHDADGPVYWNHGTWIPAGEYILCFLS